MPIDVFSSSDSDRHFMVLRFDLMCIQGVSFVMPRALQLYRIDNLLPPRPPVPRNMTVETSCTCSEKAISQRVKEITGDRIPLGARFSVPVPASYTVGTGSFLGVKRPGFGVDHPPISSDEVKERLELYFSPSGHSLSVLE